MIINEKIKNEGGILYFIEDMDTNKWYCVPESALKKGSETKPEDYWTTDPIATYAFLNKDFAKFCLDRWSRSERQFKNQVNNKWIKKNLQITGHEFVNTN